MGRVGFFVKQANPNADDAEVLARIKLAHALMMFSRGVPTLYYGDEQGFAGAGGYGNSRQDMWPSRTPVYANETPVGGRQPATPPPGGTQPGATEPAGQPFDPTREVLRDFSESLSGRTSNGLYDVRDVEIALVVDTASIPDVLDAIGTRNFMTVIGETRVLPQELPVTAERLRPVFDRLAKG